MSSFCGWKHKLKLLVLFGVAYQFFYILPNFRPLFPPVRLPLTWIDLATPFVPWTFIIYLSDYLLALAGIALIKNTEDYHSLTRMAFLALMICGTFFLFAPTTYPRPEYPTDAPFFIQMLMDLVASADMPTNCFPSMHVAQAGVFAWASRKLGKKTTILFWLWAILICFSTMTTKQHYFVDIIGGLLVTAMVAFVEWALFGSKRLQTWVARARQ